MILRLGRHLSNIWELRDCLFTLPHIQGICRRRLWKDLRKNPDNIYKWRHNHWTKLKTLRQKEKLLVLSNFSFCRNVFKNCLLQRSQKAFICGIGLRTIKQWFSSIVFATVVQCSTLSHMRQICISWLWTTYRQKVCKISINECFIIKINATKGETACSIYNLLPQCFQKSSAVDASKYVCRQE